MRRWGQSSPFRPMTDPLVELALRAARRGSAGNILWTLRRHGVEDNLQLVTVLSEALARLGAKQQGEEHRVDL